ncbi:MAG: serine/threonine protein kinase [Woeseiaceae bacterium]|nr:serine/threonine protein kinase [Woeseiaceae bacterium]
MTGDAATLAFADLQPEDIVSTLVDLSFDCDGRFLALNSYENRVYQIGIEDEGPVVAKFYRPARWSDECIHEEHAFSLDLAAQDIPVVPPMIIDGQTLKHSGHYRLAVFPCRGGRAPDLDNYELLTQLGRLIARIHLEGETKSFVHRPRIDIDSYGVQSIDYLLDNEFIPEQNREAYESIVEFVLDGVEACFERAGGIREIRLHGDFHPGNVLVNQDRLHIVDLDDCRHGPAVQDLWMFLSGDKEEQTPQLEALLEGYQSFRRFDPRELHLIEALRSLRIMHYAAWLARRWEDPAFKVAFPWFDSARYWDDHILALREQVALMQEAPLEWRDF